MTVAQKVEYLMSRCHRFERGVIYDIDRHGKDFCEMIIKNEALPSFPITITVTEDGCSLSVGQLENVAGSKKMTPDQIITAIEDIISDKVIFAMAYNDEDDLGFGSPYFSRIFAITGGDDDMSAEYDAFIAKISKPLNPRLRFFSSLKGRFFIFNYSGTLRKNITR